MPAMVKFDAEKERQRISILYSKMEEAELQEIVHDAGSLTDVAWDALQLELARRGIEKLPPRPEPEPAAADHVPERTLSPVMIRRFRDLPEASVAKSILDSSGIESFLADENTVRMDWLWSNAISGVKLWVRAEDAEAATKMLDQETPEKFELEGGGEYVQPLCPRCKSMDVTLGGLDKPASYTSLLVGLPLPLTHRGWKCHSCGNEWEEEGEANANSSENYGTDGPGDPAK